MIDPKAPGVYFEEVATGPRSIEAVGTSTAGFVGTAPNGRPSKHEAIAVNNKTEFFRAFLEGADKTTPLAQAVIGFFDNGGRRCHVVHVDDGDPLTGSGGARVGLDVLAEIDEISIVAAPGRTDFKSYEALLSHCENLGDRVGIFDAPQGVTNLMKLTEIGSATAPRRPRRPSGTGDATDGDTSATPATPEPERGLRPPMSEKGYGAFYYPWIVVPDALDRSKTILAPPSGHMAGIYARTDVHRAPAN